MSANKFKVGDHVRFRSDIRLNHTYGGFKYSEQLHKDFGGQVMEISYKGGGCYHVQGDTFYSITDEMLDSTGTPKFQMGDKVRVKNTLKVGERYDGITFLDSMRGYDTLTVKYVRYNYNNIFSYSFIETPLIMSEKMLYSDTTGDDSYLMDSYLKVTPHKQSKPTVQEDHILVVRKIKPKLTFL